ncbi:MAG: hypothetical protein ABI625_13895 [bacterium]
MDDNSRLEHELERVRGELVADISVPLGMVSRLEMGVLRAARADTGIGWEPRVTIACVVFALVEFSARATASMHVAAATAVVAVAYAWLASWPTTGKPT